MRRSAFAGRHAASKIARSSADNLIGAARRPGCDRCAHGSESIMTLPLNHPGKLAKLLTDGTSAPRPSYGEAERESAH
jgi:hypothetical protein